MNNATPRTGDSLPDAPLTDFSNCHTEIFKGLTAFAELPALTTAAERSRQIAAEVIGLFEHVVMEHHAEEERDLFPAVLASARAGGELDTVRTLIDRLVDEHREVEAMWKKLEPSLKKAAKGQPSDLDAAAVDRLVKRYSAHAAYEEAVFLPLSESILGRDSNHMAALGLSLHMRRHPYTVNAYI